MRIYASSRARCRDGKRATLPRRRGRFSPQPPSLAPSFCRQSCQLARGVTGQYARARRAVSVAETAQLELPLQVKAETAMTLIFFFSSTPSRALTKEHSLRRVVCIWSEFTKEQLWSGLTKGRRFVFRV